LEEFPWGLTRSIYAVGQKKTSGREEKKEDELPIEFSGGSSGLGGGGVDWVLLICVLERNSTKEEKNGRKEKYTSF